MKIFIDLEKPNPDGLSPLSIAVRMGNNFAVKWLLDQGVSCVNDYRCVQEAVNFVYDFNDRLYMDDPSPPWTISYLFENWYDSATGKMSLPPPIPMSTYISPSGESILLMAEKAHNDHLVDFYFKSVEKPVLVNTQTGERFLDFARKETKEKYGAYIGHIMNLVAVGDEKRCPICFEDWDNDDNLIDNEPVSHESVENVDKEHANPGQRLEFLCQKIGHPLHNRCIEQMDTSRGCPICKAPVLPKPFPRRKVLLAELKKEDKQELLGSEEGSSRNENGAEEPERSG